MTTAWSKESDGSSSSRGVMHPWVRQILLNCNGLQEFIRQTTLIAVRGCSHALGGHGRPWLAVLKHEGTLGPCFKAAN